MMVPLLIVAFLLMYLLFRSTARPRNFPPGPLNLPLVGYLPFLTEYPHKVWMQLSQKYGDVFSINMGSYRVVVLSSVQSIKSAYKEEAISGRPRLNVIKHWCQERGISFSHGQVWTEMRRFTVRQLKELGMGKSSLEGVIQEDVLEFISSIRAQEGQLMDMGIKTNLAGLNSLWTIMVGEKFCRQDDSKGVAAVESVIKYLRDSSVVNSIEFLPWLHNIGPFRSVTTASKQNVDRYRDIMRNFVEKERSKSHSESDELHFTRVFLDKVGSTKDPSSAFYGEEGYQNLTTLLMDIFAGGVDTTGVVLLWYILFMVVYPDIQKKIQAEVDKVVPSTQLPGLEHRSRMPYTEAVLLETMRFSQFGPTGLMHATLQDTKIMGYDVPKDTLVISNLYHVLHDPKHWERPEEFYPEHFLNSDGALEVPEAFIQFGPGKRFCPGESLA